MDDDRDEHDITVYRDHPEWDRYAKWFMLPSHLLNELLVARYTWRGYGEPSEADSAVQDLRKKHPDCIFVY